MSAYSLNFKEKFKRRFKSMYKGAREAYVYIADVYQSALAYSLNYKLSETQTYAFRVRRLIDNTELDIGFIGNKSDRQAVIDFCTEAGNTDGFISRVYDARGIFDLEQTTASDQLRIYDNITGLYTQDNGDLAAYCPPTSTRHLRFEAGIEGTYANRVVGFAFCVFKSLLADQGAGNVAASIWEWSTGGTGTGTRFGARVSFYAPSNPSQYLETTSRKTQSPTYVVGAASSNTMGTDTKLITSHGKWAAGETLHRENGVQTGSVSHTASNSDSGNSLNARVFTGGKGGKYVTGLWSDLILYNSPTYESNIPEIEDIMMERSVA